MNETLRGHRTAGERQVNVFDERLRDCGAGALTAGRLDVLQVNLGLRCNQTCAHCHLGASPSRSELMPPRVLRAALRAAGAARPQVVDLTGGAPELHPDIRGFVGALTAAGHPVQVRTNLTALLEPACAGLPAFFREHGVRLVGSMPCYLEENVDRQRGAGVYRRSVEALRLLNTTGYGIAPELALDLVYNPGGVGLPPGQAGLESDYRRELRARHGVEFTRLLTIANLPLGRFGDALRRDGHAGAYLELLKRSFNPCTVPHLMCRSQVEVAWDGRLYDCDFNLALGLPVGHGAPDDVERFDAALLAGRHIVTGAHCFGCTAGAGSSCRGALTAA
jgi:radical SAM/Cys-rich protein